MSLSTLRIALSASVALTVAGPAFAIFPKLSTSLTGAPISGVAPTGNANVDQSKLPKTPGTLSIEVKNVNLPDGTTLAVEIDQTVVGSIRLSRGGGRLNTSIPNQMGRNATLNVATNGVVILTNPSAWKT